MLTNVLTQQTKIVMAHQIAKDYGYFICNVGTIDKQKWLLYHRPGNDRSVFVGKRSSVDGILSLIKKVTGWK